VLNKTAHLGAPKPYPDA